MKVVLTSSQRHHLCIRSVSADEYWTVSTRLLGLASADICYFVDGQTALISFHSPLSSFVFVARNRPVFQFAVAFRPFYISCHLPCTSLLSLFSFLPPCPSPRLATAKRHVAHSVRTQLPPLGNRATVCNQCDAKKENPCSEFKLVCQAPPGQAYYSCAAKAAPPTPRPACYTDGNCAGSCANPGKSDAYCIRWKQDSDCMRVFTAPKASCVNSGTADAYLEVQGLQYG
ncbi:hypothetical protein B0H13DRAFT_2126225 [Mycena leptocephala]|nr:hypothetical protein B0H13DRAFT_2126225 [Mycena leptocephala]